MKINRAQEGSQGVCDIWGSKYMAMASSTLGTTALSPAHPARQVRNVCCKFEKVLNLGLTQCTLVSVLIHSRRVKLIGKQGGAYKREL